jgi:AraC family transcriptional regulator of adaptative response/methylated-DNA-[protein]-cysteine methyltransferase
MPWRPSNHSTGLPESTLKKTHRACGVTNRTLNQGYDVTMANVTPEINSIAWNAILKRDRRHDGKFVYAALTTGIYCRPSCPARHPHRRNTLLISTAAEAEADGFIACRRCFPETDALTHAELSIKSALEWIETHIQQPITLGALSQITGLSPNHLQQTFKRIVGLSPKSFCDARRLAHFKNYIKQGASVSNASYLAGYGSSRALYEKATQGMGMTPGVYGRGGRGTHINYALFPTNLGRTLVAATSHGICAILVGNDDKQLVKMLRREFPNSLLTRKNASWAKWNATVNLCQEEDRLVSVLPLDLRRRIFQAKAWKALQ